jgi:acetyl esterase/lipase
LIVWIHGGGWQGGSRKLEAGARQRVLPHTERGYALASIDYRLSGEAIFPAQIQDVKAALRFLRENARRYNVDPGRIAVWGTSAGAHLAALAATSDGVAALEDPSQGNAGQTSRVQAAIDCYGPTDLLQMDSANTTNGCSSNHDSDGSPESRLMGCAIQTCADAVATANPLIYVDAGDPPMLLGHGDADCNVPWQQSQLLHEALEAAGVPSSLTIVPGGAHAIQSCPPDAEIGVFLDSLLLSP